VSELENMIDWFVAINGILRNLRIDALNALEALQQNDMQRLGFINGQMQNSYEALEKQHKVFLNTWRGWWSLQEYLSYLERHIRFGEYHDYLDILHKDIPLMEDKLDKILLAYHEVINSQAQKNTTLVDVAKLIHPVISEYALSQFVNGHYQNAVFDSIKAILQIIRTRVKLNNDGEALITKVFSPNNPMLVFDTMQTETGINIQKGFMMILQGAVKGVRNPTAHGFEKITQFEALQYLIFASLLADKIDKATSPVGCSPTK
jgi:uncharacterized protein (TIGR02391 family)